MAKDNIIQFPNKKQRSEAERAEMLRSRLDEIEVENRYINDDIDYLKGALAKNIAEAQDILKKFAIMNGESPVMDFANEWGDDFEFTPDFDLSELPELETTDEPVDKTTEKWDEVANKLNDVAKDLADQVQQLVLDLDINTNNDKEKE